MITAERLREVLDYDQDTGVFTWKLALSFRRSAGQTAGASRVDGRRIIGIEGTRYLCSRLAWLYVHGRWPSPCVDHIDRDRSNDRIANLREATHSLNMINFDRSQKTLRYRGIERKRGRYAARITLEGERHNLGVFDTQEEAARAYDVAAEELHGSFAVLNFSGET